MVSNPGGSGYCPFQGGGYVVVVVVVDDDSLFIVAPLVLCVLGAVFGLFFISSIVSMGKRELVALL